MRIDLGCDHSRGMQRAAPEAPVPDLVAAYTEHARFIERVLRRAGVAERDVPDARQDVFVVAHRKLASFEGRGRLSTWLYRIAWNVASEYRRRACHRREQLGAASCAPEREQDHDRDDSQVLRLEHRELLSHALRALDELDDDKREAFVLAEVVGLSMREIAARVGCPVKTAFSRAYAARRRVLAALRERGVVLGIVPALAPLRFQRPRSALTETQATSSGLLAAQVQLALVSLVCAALPGLAASGVASETGDGVLAGVARPLREVRMRIAPLPDDSHAHPAIIASAGSLRASRTAHPPRPLRPPPLPVPGPALEPPASAVEATSELIVVRDGSAWLVPAVTHPLDRAPADRPALPPFVIVRGPRAELGRLDARLPAFE